MSERRPRSSSASASPAWRWRAGSRATAPRVRVWDSRAEPPQAAALREHVPQRRAHRRRARRGGARRRRPRAEEPGPGAARRAHRRRARRGARRPGCRCRASSTCSPPRSRRCARRADYAPKVIAVTGTNGKTTTTALTALLVERSGKRVAVAGNIGPTMLQTLADAIDAGPAESLRERLPEVWVLELSSFQLDGSDRAASRPTPRRCSTSARTTSTGTARWPPTRAAKARVFGTRAIDRRQPRRRRRRCSSCRRRRRCRRRGRAARRGRRARASSRFGAGVPERPGDWGLAVEQRHGLAGRARSTTTTRRTARRDRPAAPDAGRRAAHPRPPQRRQRARRAGAGRARSAARSRRCCTGCASTAASRTGSSTSPRVDGVDAFDDSKGTNVGATVAALRRPRRRARAGQARRHPRRRRQGPGLRAARRAAARATRARSLTIGRDAAAIERGARADRRRRSSAARRSRPRSTPAFARAQPRRRGAAQPGVRQPRHVPQLRAPRRGLRRRGAGDRADAGDRRERAHDGVLAGACQSWRDRPRAGASARPRVARREVAAPRGRRASPSRSRCANGSASTAASRRACSASTAPWSASSSPCSRSAW